MLDLRVFPGRQHLSEAVAEAFVQAAVERVTSRGRFSVALSGGRTPRHFLEMLGQKWRDRVPWSVVHFFWSDERYVPAGHKDSNVLMARESLLNHVPVPPENIHAPPTELEDPETAARRYEDALAKFFGGEAPCLDWLFLGLGEDGHVASLFPGSTALDEKKRWIVVVRDSPKPPPIRLTMTFELINQAAHVHFLVAGEEKAEAVRATLEAPPDRHRCPAQGVRPRKGHLTWWVTGSGVKNG